MAAHVEHDFQNHFELNEEKLRRIHSILKKRITDNNQEIIKFIVTRDDNLIYPTNNIDDIINEPNDSASKINEIDIHYTSDNLELEIGFSNKYGSTLKISGEDRDNVFLLYSELKDYIAKEVSNLRNLSWLRSKFFLPFFMLTFMLYMAYLFWGIKQTPSETVNQLISTTNLNEKINYLILKANERDSLTPPLMPLFAFMGIAIITPLLPITKCLNYLRPVNTFLFGKEIQVVENRRKTTSNIFWVVIVGGILGLALAYIAPKLF